MLNQSIQCALTVYTNSDEISRETLDEIQVESNNLCEAIEYGLMELGDLIQKLGYLADEKQNFTNQAMSNANVKHIGGLIKANAYLLNALRETNGFTQYHLTGGLKGALEREARNNETK